LRTAIASGLAEVRFVIGAHRGESAAMMISKLVVGIAVIRADDAGDARVASGGAIGFDFNPMSQTARDIPSGGRAYR